MSLENHAYSLPQLEVVLKHHDETTKRKILEVTPGFRIGRDTSADFRLNDPTVSRLHAELRVVNETIEIRDLTSSFGVYLNATRISPEMWTVLRSTDALWLGEVRLQFKLLQSGDDAHFNPTVALNRITALELSLSTTDELVSYSIPADSQRILEPEHLPSSFRHDLAGILPLIVDHSSPLALHVQGNDGKGFTIVPGESRTIAGIDFQVVPSAGDWNLSSVAMSREALINQLTTNDRSVAPSAHTTNDPHDAKIVPVTKSNRFRDRAPAIIEAILLLAAVVVGIGLMIVLFADSPAVESYDSEPILDVSPLPVSPRLPPSPRSTANTDPRNLR